MPVPDKTQLPHLLRLLDDDAPDVRDSVARSLSAFGPELRPALGNVPGGEVLWPRVRKLIGEHRRAQLLNDWEGWYDISGERSRIEAACERLSKFLGGRETVDLKPRLDKIAEEFRQAHPQGDAKELAHFLFQTKDLRGAEPDEYYRPANSDLISVLERKRGLPVTLTTVYMLVGHRLALEIEGCNFPGHFLARIRAEGRTLLVDCFHRGRFFGENDLLKTHQGPTEGLRRLIYEKTDAETVVRRMLRTLVGAFEKSEELENRRLMADLLAQMESRR
jgi:regulator of sirC expression with transglutaminase-like and TPR domain